MQGISIFRYDYTVSFLIQSWPEEVCQEISRTTTQNSKQEGDISFLLDIAKLILRLPA